MQNNNEFHRTLHYTERRYEIQAGANTNVAAEAAQKAMTKKLAQSTLATLLLVVATVH